MRESWIGLSISVCLPVQYTHTLTYSLTHSLSYTHGLHFLLSHSFILSLRYIEMCVCVYLRAWINYNVRSAKIISNILKCACACSVTQFALALACNLFLLLLFVDSAFRIRFLTKCVHSSLLVPQNKSGNNNE